MNFRQEKRIFYNWMKKRGILENYKRNREDPLIGRSRIIRKADRLVITPFYWMPSRLAFLPLSFTTFTTKTVILWWTVWAIRRLRARCSQGRRFPLDWLRRSFAERAPCLGISILSPPVLRAARGFRRGLGCFG